MSGSVVVATIPIPTVPVNNPATGQLDQAWYRFFLALLERTGSAGGTAGGDLSGYFPNPTVAKINGATLGSTSVTSGNILIADGAAWQSSAMKGDATIASSGTLTLANTAVTPGSYGSATQVGTFTVNSKGLLTAAANVTISGAAPGGAAGGDLSGTYPNPTVAKVNAVAYPASPSTGTVPLVTAANTVTYTATTGTGNIVRDTTPTLAGNWQIPGTATNDSAAAGFDGEYTSSTVLSGSAVALTTATPANVTSISLTAGDWDVWGTVGFLPDVTTTITDERGGIGTTSATLPTSPGSGAYVDFPLVFTTGAESAFPVGAVRVSLSGTTTVYLVAQAAFAVSTMGAYGFIGARRRR